MTNSEWLDSRVPAPPSALRERLHDALAADGATADRTQACLHAAERLIERLLRGDCTTRESALDLLAADALMTYAFEAAGDSPGDLRARARHAMRSIAAQVPAQASGERR